MPIYETIIVELGYRSYPIVIGTGILPELAESDTLAGLESTLAIVSNPTVFEFYGSQVEKALKHKGARVLSANMDSGEKHKTMETVTELCRQLVQQGVDRKSVILALGGGVVGDVAGFVAAILLRGIGFVQIPTTLLAMVDSSVGGKTGVDLPEGKNLVGAFYQPQLVWIDLTTLDSLSAREISAGLAEVIKYGVIWDAEFFAQLETEAREWVRPQGLERFVREAKERLAHIVGRCCTIKAEVVSRDEHERDLRAILNYGHTIGHAIESLTGYDTYLHGEAIAIGMVAAAQIAQRMGLIDQGLIERLTALLKAARLPVAPPSVDPQAFVQAMQRDKKTRRGRIRMVLPVKCGEVEQVEQVEPELIVEVMRAGVSAR